MNSNVRVNNKLENISKKLDKKGMNQISNISYNAKDLSGNQYRVKSEFGEFIENNQDVLLLTTVEAIITFKRFRKPF